MYYLKSKNYTRFCLLVGCLFSVKVLVTDHSDIVHAQETDYVYELDDVENNESITMPVDPLDPTVEVKPLPPSFTPQKKAVTETEKFYLSELPNGKVPILIKEEVNDKKVKHNLLAQKYSFTLTTNDGENSSNDEDNLSYLEELYIALSGVMLYGEEVFIGKEE